MRPVIGIAFDNTVIDYDHLFYRIAIQRELIPLNTIENKRYVRDRIWQLPDGDIEWQKLQGIAYGSRISDASPAIGVVNFLRGCLVRRIRVSIVSHKTEFASYDETVTNLRSAAILWMVNNLGLDNSGLGFSRDDIYFEPTRKDKVLRVGWLGCTHFIDDLVETFQEDQFPTNVKKILYSPMDEPPDISGIEFFGDWKSISDYLFS